MRFLTKEIVWNLQKNHIVASRAKFYFLIKMDFAEKFYVSFNKK